MDAAYLEELVAIAKEVDAYIFSDEVYRSFDQPTPSIVDLYEKGIAVNSLSKTYSIPGIRVGWVASNTEVADILRDYRDYTMICAGVFDDMVATLVLENKEAILERNRQIVEENLALMDEWIATQRVMDKDDPKVVYYMSMEFLMGRALGNNLINLSAYKEVKEALNEIGVDINAIEDQEPDPALGNGGLGRLAACFMDSLATLGYPAYGCGIRYRYGMFKQQISDGFQIEVPDNWLKDGYPFELRRPEYCYEVKFGGYVQESTDENGELHFEQKDYQSVLAVPYDMPIVGYDNNVVNSLMIWDAEPKKRLLARVL